MAVSRPIICDVHSLACVIRATSTSMSTGAARREARIDSILAPEETPSLTRGPSRTCATSRVHCGELFAGRRYRARVMTRSAFRRHPCRAPHQMRCRDAFRLGAGRRDDAGDPRTSGAVRPECGEHIPRERPAAVVEIFSESLLMERRDFLLD